MSDTYMENGTKTVSRIIKPGDLLFQLSTGGEREWLISRLFEGVKGQALNHVALYVGHNQVIEAVSPTVKKTSIDTFIRKSVIDTSGRACITIARLLPEYISLIPEAIAFAEGCLSTPYDDSYGSQQGWYCSQLILEAFRHANGGCYLFKPTPMSFRNPETGEYYSYWVEFYKRLGVSIPEGDTGSHPAMVSISKKINIVKVYGMLPFKNKNYNGTVV